MKRYNKFFQKPRLLVVSKSTKFSIALVVFTNILNWHKYISDLAKRNDFLFRFRLLYTWRPSEYYEWWTDKPKLTDDLLPFSHRSKLGDLLCLRCSYYNRNLIPLSANSDLQLAYLQNLTIRNLKWQQKKWRKLSWFSLLERYSLEFSIMFFFFLLRIISLKTSYKVINFVESFNATWWMFLLIPIITNFVPVVCEKTLYHNKCIIFLFKGR